MHHNLLYNTLGFKKIQKHSPKLQSYNVTYIKKLDTSFLGLELIFEASKMNFLVMKLSLR